MASASGSQVSASAHRNGRNGVTGCEFLGKGGLPQGAGQRQRQLTGAQIMPRR